MTNTQMKIEEAAYNLIWNEEEHLSEEELQILTDIGNGEYFDLDRKSIDELDDMIDDIDFVWTDERGRFFLADVKREIQTAKDNRIRQDQSDEWEYWHDPRCLGYWLERADREESFV